MTPRTTTSRRRRGFTLVEAISSIVVISIVGLVGSRLVLEVSKVMEGTARRAELSNSLNLLMERVMSDLSSIDAVSGAAIITAPGSSDITYEVNGKERILWLTNSTVIFSDSSRDYLLADNISNFTLSYYDKNNAVLTGLAALDPRVRSIQLTVTATKASYSETLRSRVFIRSLSSGSGAS